MTKRDKALQKAWENLKCYADDTLAPNPRQVISQVWWICFILREYHKEDIWPNP